MLKFQAGIYRSNFLFWDEALLQQDSPFVAVVIVNYRTPGLTIDCLRSLETEVSTVPGTKVYVVDNASGDGSVDQIQEAIQTTQWQSWAEILPQDRNGGFAFGNNAAIRPLLISPQPPAFFWLLNSDTLVLPGSLRALIAALETNSTVGIAGSRLENPDGSPQVSAFRFHSITSEFLSAMRLGVLDRIFATSIVSPPVSDKEHATDWLAGASFLVRRSVFEQVGLLDEEYFLYFEEVDLCSRAKKAGWKCLYVPESRVIHLVGQSSGVTASNAAERRMPSYWFDSRRRYFILKYGKLRYAMANASWLVGHLVYRMRRWFQAKPAQIPEQILSDFLKHSLRF